MMLKEFYFLSRSVLCRSLRANIKLMTLNACAS